MKILSVGIPCYNSMEYMDKAIESLLVCKDDVEIIIVNDGSKDKTDEIGKMYQEKYPDTVKYVYQENGGHGEAVNTGLRNATGLFYKVLDSDDWFDSEVFVRVIKKLKELEANKTNIDMCNIITKDMDIIDVHEQIMMNIDIVTDILYDEFLKEDAN